MIRRLVLLVVGLGPAAAAAFIGTSVKAGARDAETGKVLDGAFVVVREYGSVGKFHGSSQYCIRAGAAAVDQPWVRMDIPGPGSDLLTASRAFEGIAYRPGYCMARIGNAANAASHKRMTQRSASSEYPELDPGNDARFDMKRAAQAPEERLLYLERVGLGLLCTEARWGEGSREALARLSEAMLGEVNAIARSKYEKHLASKVAARLEVAREMPRWDAPVHATVHNRTVGSPALMRDFIVVPGDSQVTWSGGGATAVAPAPTLPQARAARSPAPGIVENSRYPSGINPAPAIPPRAPLAVYCRHGNPEACDLDERNTEGETALWSYAWSGNVAAVRALLQAGADPNVAKRHGGRTAIEMAIDQVLLNYDNAAKAVEVVELLAADPRTTLFASLRDDIAADPATWKIHSPRARERLLQHREALTRLPARQATKPGCENPGFDVVYEQPPPRLR